MSPISRNSIQRLLVVIDGFAMGGAERQLLQLLKTLRPDLQDITVFSTGAVGPLLQPFGELVDRLVSRPKRTKFDLTLFPALQKVAAQQQPDLCVSVLFYADVVAAFGTPGVPKLTWQHVSPSRDLKNRRFYHRWTYRRALPRFSSIVCCATCVQEDLKATYDVPSNRMQTVHNGVDVQRFAFKRSGKANSNFDLGMVGRFSPEKGHAELLNAMHQLGDRLPEVRLHLYGEGPQRLAIEALAQSLGLGTRVFFHGIKDQMQDVYGSLDALVAPSQYEANPLAVIEAMACGCPVVGSDVAGIREATGGHALLYPPGDAGALSRAIIEIASHREKYHDMTVKARKHVEAEFDFRKQHSLFWKQMNRAAAAATAPRDIHPESNPGK